MGLLDWVAEWRAKKSLQNLLEDLDGLQEHFTPEIVPLIGKTERLMLMCRTLDTNLPVKVKKSVSDLLNDVNVKLKSVERVPTELSVWEQLLTLAGRHVSVAYENSSVSDAQEALRFLTQLDGLVSRQVDKNRFIEEKHKLEIFNKVLELSKLRSEICTIYQHIRKDQSLSTTPQFKKFGALYEMFHFKKYSKTISYFAKSLPKNLNQIEYNMESLRDCLILVQNKDKKGLPLAMVFVKKLLRNF